MFQRYRHTPQEIAEQPLAAPRGTLAVVAIDDERAQFEGPCAAEVVDGRIVVRPELLRSASFAVDEVAWVEQEYFSPTGTIVASAVVIAAGTVATLVIYGMATYQPPRWPLF